MHVQSYLHWWNDCSRNSNSKSVGVPCAVNIKKSQRGNKGIMVSSGLGIRMQSGSLSSRVIIYHKGGSVR